MIRLAVAGLGKMGLSHHAMINMHPDVKLVAICDATTYVLDVLKKYTGVSVYSNFERMLDEEELDAVIIATPSSLHGKMVRAALEKNLHVFCEKPFTLSPEEGERLTQLAQSKRLVNQVGYHYRFVGAFKEVKKLLDFGVIGEISNVLAEAYGPVVLRPKGSTWRTQRAAGGGCLYDYAAHPINLINWYVGMPTAVGGSALNSIFSKETDDEVLSTLHYPGGRTAQLCVNWSDESHRKMTTKITLFGTTGKIIADRQEIQVFLRDGAKIPQGYRLGWNVRYTTELTEEVWYYVRGEEYSAQLDYFVQSIKNGASNNVNSFAEALKTDKVMEMIVADASLGPREGSITSTQSATPAKKGFFSTLWASR